MVIGTLRSICTDDFWTLRWYLFEFLIYWSGSKSIVLCPILPQLWSRGCSSIIYMYIWAVSSYSRWYHVSEVTAHCSCSNVRCETLSQHQVSKPPPKSQWHILIHGTLEMLTWYRGCLRKVFWVCSCSYCTSRSISLEWKQALYGYAHDSTLVAVVPSTAERVAVTDYGNRDLNRVSVWWNLFGIKLNASKTKTIIVSWSRSVHPQLTPFTLDGTVLQETADVVILSVTFDAKMTPEKRLRSVSIAAAQRLGIMHEKDLASISWSVAPSEIFFELCPVGLVVLLISVPIHILNYRTELSGVLFF